MPNCHRCSKVCKSNRGLTLHLKRCMSGMISNSKPKKKTSYLCATCEKNTRLIDRSRVMPCEDTSCRNYAYTCSTCITNAKQPPLCMKTRCRDNKCSKY